MYRSHIVLGIQKLRYKTMKDTCRFSLPVLLLFFLLQKTAIGTDATQVNIIPTGLCVAPGDTISLDCNVRSAPNKQTRVMFYKGSMPIDEVYIEEFTTLCRLADSGTVCRSWDLSARFSVGVASESDRGVYWCRAEDDVKTYGRNASATVFVQHQSEFYLSDDVTVMAVNLGGKVTVPLTRKCDKTEPVQVTRPGKDGRVEVIPYAYDHKESAYVDRVDGKLVIPHFSCTDVANYTFTIMAGRGYEPVTTAKSIHITLNDSCKGCCQEHATPTPETNGLTDRKPTAARVTGSPNQLGEAEDNTVYVVIIVLLVLGLVASHVGVYVWRRRSRSFSHVDAEAGKDEAHR